MLFTWKGKIQSSTGDLGEKVCIFRSFLPPVTTNEGIVQGGKSEYNGEECSKPELVTLLWLYIVVIKRRFNAGFSGTEILALWYNTCFS